MNPFSRPLNVVFLLVTAILVSGAIVFALQTTEHNVTFDIKKSDYKVTLYDGVKANNKVINTFDSTAIIPLTDGYYCYEVSGEKYTDTETCFSVYKTDTKVTVTPKYTDNHLRTLLATEIDQINTTIQQNYGDKLSTYENITGKLVDNGNWYIGILKERIVNPGEVYDTYVYLLEKKGETWEVAVNPSLVISAVEYNKIPKNVIDLANNYLNDYVRSLDG